MAKKHEERQSISHRGETPAAVQSVFEPRVSRDGRAAAVAVVVQQLLLGRDVSGRHQDQVGAPVDGVELRLAVSALAVVDEPPQALRLQRSVHTVVQD